MPSDAPEPLEELAADTKKNLLARGFDEQRVEVISKKATREQILERLRSLGSTARGEFWLVLFGQSGRMQGGIPAFQVSGPRLTANDVKSALDAIPGPQFVFIGTGNSGGFLPLLHNERRTVLSATQADAEPDQPRFLAAWVNQFSLHPRAPFAEIAARASAGVRQECQDSGIAQAEHAQLIEAAGNTLLSAPFGVNLSPTNTIPSGSSN
jgi:hypothetical protein